MNFNGFGTILFKIYDLEREREREGWAVWLCKLCACRQYVIGLDRREEA